MPWGINHYSKGLSFSWSPFIKAYEQLREGYYSPWKIINKKSTTRWAPINQKMEWNGAPFKIDEGGVLAPTSKEAHVCNGKNGLHWLLGVPLDCHEFILCKIQPEFGASFLYHLFWWYFDKIHADSVETFQGTKHQTPGNSGRWVKQSHRIILVRSWFIIAFQDIKVSRFHHSFSHFSTEPTMWFHKFGGDDWAYNFGFQISSPGSLTFPIGYTSGQLRLTGAQPPANCSFAGHFVAKMAILCAFAHHKAPAKLI